MAIVNRDLDGTQQVETLVGQVSGTVSGNTYCMATIPYPAQVIAASECAMGLSGAPNHSLWIQRFIAGSGVTSIAIGASMAAVAFGTSGGQSFTLISAFTNLLQTGDLVLLSVDGANTAAKHVSVTLVVQALQDIKTSFNQSPG